MDGVKDIMKLYFMWTVKTKNELSKFVSII